MADYTRAPAPTASGIYNPRHILYQMFRERDTSSLEAYLQASRRLLMEVKQEEAFHMPEVQEVIPLPSASVLKLDKSSDAVDVEKDMLEMLEEVEEVEDTAQLNPKRRHSSRMKETKEDDDWDWWDEEGAECEEVPPPMEAVPLKKRSRMKEVPYAIGHVINKNITPVMTFTQEEEFQVINFIVRIEQYQNRRFEFLEKNFQMYRELTVAYVKYTASGKKIPFNREIETKLFVMGLDFTKTNTADTYEEMAALGTGVRKAMLNSTYPALYVVMFAILEGNTREASWIQQHKKTVHITKENHRSIKSHISGLENVRAISLKDQERFSSPWAVEMADEEKFEKTIAMVGRILRDDLQLQALYHMLVMMTPSPRGEREVQEDPSLQYVQVRLCQLIYRYLSSGSTAPAEEAERLVAESSIMQRSRPEESSDLSPDEKTRLLISLLDDVHDCADIMLYRSL